MRQVINAIVESTNLALLVRESEDPALRHAAYRLLVMLETATDRLVALRRAEDAKD